MKVNCLNCGIEFNEQPNRIKQGKGKFCSRNCVSQYKNHVQYTYQHINKICIVCGDEFTTLDKYESRKTCSDQCSKSRKISKTTYIQINKKRAGPNYISTNLYRNKCLHCSKEFDSSRRIKKFCSNKCRKKARQSYYQSDAHRKICSAGGKATIAKHYTKSKIEDELCQLLSRHKLLQSDKEALNGFEIDILLDALNFGIEYRGPWHYRNIMSNGTLGATRNRDRLKERIARKNNIYLHPICWALKSHDTINRLKRETYFVEQVMEYMDGQMAPFAFLYDFTKFSEEYDQLCRATPHTANSNQYCINLIEFYHKHIWYMKTSRSQINAIDYWHDNTDLIITNREKYANLLPRSIRRYFKIFDIVPSMFPDAYGRLMAEMIDGDTIADPFAGFGGRMLGTCSAGKRYIGYDNHPETANANAIIASDFRLDAEINHSNSSEITPIECDGLITSPPYYNKDDYGNQYRSLGHFKDMMRTIFNKFIINDKAIIDFKQTPGCTINDLTETLPWKVSDILEINFGGLGRQSYHSWLICEPH